MQWHKMHKAKKTNKQKKANWNRIKNQTADLYQPVADYSYD